MHGAYQSTITHLFNIDIKIFSCSTATVTQRIFNYKKIKIFRIPMVNPYISGLAIRWRPTDKHG